MTSTDILTVARAEALFTSNLSAAEDPTPAQVDAAIQRAMRTYGGTRACAGEVAAAYGEYPEAAASRMRWARIVVERAYQPPRPRIGAALHGPREPVPLPRPDADQQASPGLAAPQLQKDRCAVLNTSA